MEIPNDHGQRKYACGFVHIMRGLPGSGKSTIIKEMLADPNTPGNFTPDNVAICSADDYMIDPKTGEYCFRDYMIKKVHTLCYLKFLKLTHTATVDHIVIDNTNLQHIDFVNYFVAARTFNYDIVLHQLYDSGFTNEELAKRCVHNIKATGKGSIAAMRKKWERFNITKLETLIKIDNVPGTEYVLDRCTGMPDSDQGAKPKSSSTLIPA